MSETKTEQDIRILKDTFDVSTVISRVAFIFLVYVIISSGYISEVLSCQMRKFLTTSLYFRHIFAIVMVFVFIMFEGGWDFDKREDDKAPTSWSSGNTLHTFILAILLYFAFLISSKSKLIPNLLFFGALFILYVVNTYRDYIFVRNYISYETNERILFAEKILIVITTCILIYGFVDYYFYQLADHQKDFSWVYFLFGTSKCKSLQ